MTRSVQDCLTVDGVLSGAMLKVKRRPLSGMRFALPQTTLLEGLDATVSKAFARSVSMLAAAGAQIVDISLAELSEIPKLNAPGGLSPIEAYAVHHARLAKSKEGFDHRVAARVALGAPVTAQQYLAMLDNRLDWIARVEHAIEGFDAVLCPTTPIIAPEIAKLEASDEAFFKANGQMLRNTFAFNFLDGCSFSLPCHIAGEQAVGLMLSSVRGDDAALAAVALAVEAALASR